MYVPSTNQGRRESLLGYYAAAPTHLPVSRPGAIKDSYICFHASGGGGDIQEAYRRYRGSAQGRKRISDKDVRFIFIINVPSLSVRLSGLPCEHFERRRNASA